STIQKLTMPDPTPTDEEDLSMYICKEPPVRSRRVKQAAEAPPTDEGEEAANAVDPEFKASFAVLSAERDRVQQRLFAAFGDCIPVLKDSIENVQAFLARSIPLAIHLQNVRR
ncbi:hypothetical protein KIPB_014646, partial [Kipferlia bialata]